MRISINYNKHDHSPHSSTWLKLAIGSLIAAGVFAVLLVFSRTPGIQDYIPWIDFFHTALVVHVNLSVLIWFMSFAALLWSLHAGTELLVYEKAALILAITGTLIIIVSPFAGAGDPLINNYIPVLQHPLFMIGLGVFSLGIISQLIRVLIISTKKATGVFEFTSRLAAVFTLFSCIAFLWTWYDIDPSLEGVAYYEFLFWGSGHILQFTHTCFLLFAWLLLSSHIGITYKLNETTTKWLFALLLLPIMYAAWIYASFDIVTQQHRDHFTSLMKYGGLLSMPLGVLIVWSLLVNKTRKSTEISACKGALYSSIILFAAGGLIGFLIHGVNVVIPAHYHGSIVGVTLAYMGVTYYLLPRFGYRNPQGKMATVQPYLYGGGQLLHITGLAISGGYGVQRKVAGGAQGLDSLHELASFGLRLMGIGGGLSILGGLLFLIIVIKCMRPEKNT